MARERGVRVLAAASRLTKKKKKDEGHRQAAT